MTPRAPGVETLTIRLIYSHDPEGFVEPSRRLRRSNVAHGRVVENLCPVLAFYGRAIGVCLDYVAPASGLARRYLGR